MPYSENKAREKLCMTGHSRSHVESNYPGFSHKTILEDLSERPYFIMAETWHGKANNSSDSASIGSVKLVNPTRKSNWPPQPSSREEFQVWMEQTKEALQTWLREAQDRARYPETKKDIDAYNARALQEWQSFEIQTDEQTGTIWNPPDQERMEQQMELLNEERATLHHNNETYVRSIEYSAAQAAWEDFLFYQNVWNRRNERTGIPLRVREPKKTESQEAVVKPKSNLGKEAQNFIRGTEGQDSLTRFSEKPPRGNYFNYWEVWSTAIVSTFREFEHGYRKKAPEFIDPSNAHQYYQPPRGTIFRNGGTTKKRRNRFRERFPRKKLKATEYHENEEGFRRFEVPARASPSAFRKKDLTHINWSIDKDTVEDHMRQKEEKNRHVRDADVGLHQACLEKSSDAQTSFESHLWGNTVSRTCMLKELVSDTTTSLVQSSEQHDSAESSGGTDPMVNAASSAAMPVEKPRYKAKISMKVPRNFNLARTQEGKVRRPKKGQPFGGAWEDEKQEQECLEFELNNGERIKEDENPKYRMSYRTIIMKDHARTTRRSRHENADALDQLSDTSGSDSDPDSDSPDDDTDVDAQGDSGEQTGTPDGGASQHNGGQYSNKAPPGDGNIDKAEQHKKPQKPEGSQKPEGGGGGREGGVGDDEVDPYAGDQFWKSYEE